MDERELFENRFKLHRRKIMAVALRYTKREAIAEDITQQTFLRAWIHRESFLGRSQFATWLYRIAINTAINYLVREKPHGYVFDEDWMHGHIPKHYMYNSPVHLLAEQEHLDLVETALMEMPESMRVTFMLNVFEGGSYEDIAETLNIPIGTVRSRIHRARAMLRERFADIL